MPSIGSCALASILAVGCSSPSGGVAPPSVDAGTTIGVPEAGDAASTAPATDAAAPPDTCAPTTYYLDQDGDGFGGDEKQSACAPPSTEWVLRTGDCDDTNPSVVPDAKQFHAQPYTTPAGALSYDYDCDGVEEPAPGTPTTYFEGCTTSAGCAASVANGYVKPLPDRAGVAGVNPYCGATQTADCAERAHSASGITYYSCDTITSQAPVGVLCR